MEGYSEPAPADLWEQLEKELDTVPKVIIGTWKMNSVSIPF